MNVDKTLVYVANSELDKELMKTKMIVDSIEDSCRHDDNDVDNKRWLSKIKVMKSTRSIIDCRQ